MQASTSDTNLKLTKNWLKQQKHFAGYSITLSILTSIGAAICLIAQTSILAIIVNQLVFLDSRIQQQSHLLMALLALILTRVLLVKYTERLAFKGAMKIKLALREMLYDKLCLLGPSYVEQQHSAALAELLQQGTEELEAYYAKYLPALAFCSIIPLAILAIILPLDWRSGLIFLVTAPLIPMFMILIGLKAEKLNQTHWLQLSRMSNRFLDVLQGLAQLKLFNASRAEAAVIASISDKYRRSTMSILKTAFLSSFALEFLATLSIAMVAVTVGFRLFWGEMDFALGFMLLLLAPDFYLPFRNLGTQYHAKMKGVAAAQEMLVIMNATPRHTGNETLAVIEPSSDIDISYHNIGFNYPDGRVALKNLSLSIDKPGLYAVIGPSGAGKSTLIDLLLGFIQPQHGKITINSQELSKLKRDSWQKQIAWVPQNPQLFYGSILQNIQIADPSASFERVMQAAKNAGVDQFIESFDDTWQHLIQEQGSGISGGQKQRIAMARVFLKQAPILILDEPSAHLDNTTQQWLKSSLERYAKNHYVIVIAHKLHTIKAAKSIFLLDHGELCASGSHDELLSSPLYRQLLDAHSHTGSYFEPQN